MTYQLVVPQVLSVDANGITYAPENSPHTQYFVPAADPIETVVAAAELSIHHYAEAEDLELSPIPPTEVVWGVVNKPAGEWLPVPA